MGSPASLPTNEDGTITIAKNLVEEHLRKLSDLESRNRALIAHRDSNQHIYIRLANLTEENRRLKREIEEVWIPNSMMTMANTENVNAVSRLNTKIVAQQATIDELTQKIQETEEKLTQEAEKATGTLNMLANERKQNKVSKQELKKQYAAVKVQKGLLDRELTELKKSKQLAIQAALEVLNKRAETVNNKIINNVKQNKRENYAKQFHNLNNENERMIKNLTGVTFTTRFFQGHHDALLKLQAQNDELCMGTIKTIHGISNECRKLINDYNSIPNNFLRAIADYTRDMDTLEEVNFSSEFEKEGVIQKEILINLKKEREVLENILKVEKSNPNNSQVRNDKPNNMEYVNNLCSKNVLVVRNMEEGTDQLDDVIKFEAFIRHTTGRKIFIDGVERYGAIGKEPRPARITLKTEQDLDDVLNSKNPSDEYGHIKVETFNPKRKRVKKNVNVDNVNK